MCGEFELSARNIQFAPAENFTNIVKKLKQGEVDRLTTEHPSIDPKNQDKNVLYFAILGVSCPSQLRQPAHSLHKLPAENKTTGCDMSCQGGKFRWRRKRTGFPVQMAKMHSCLDGRCRIAWRFARHNRSNRQTRCIGG